MQVGGCQGRIEVDVRRGIEEVEMAQKGFRKGLSSTGSWSSPGKRVSCKSVVGIKELSGER